MQRAKTFFYVSLGILALAASFELGARSAAGSTTGMAVRAGISMPAEYGPVAAAVDPGGMIWALEHSAGSPAGPLAPPKPGPIASVLVSGADAASIQQAVVLYEDGDFFEFSGNQWQYYGNVFAAATPSKASTWGRVKAERR